ncbi:MAG: hypothetical protein H6621_01445 [Halobacteriovoraceae bacterium]|nr:hypothetical protein [Halobacteriovoraceae bacterium]
MRLGLNLKKFTNFLLLNFLLGSLFLASASYAQYGSWHSSKKSNPNQGSQIRSYTNTIDSGYLNIRLNNNSLGVLETIDRSTNQRLDGLNILQVIVSAQSLDRRGRTSELSLLVNNQLVDTISNISDRSEQLVFDLAYSLRDNSIGRGIRSLQLESRGELAIQGLSLVVEEQSVGLKNQRLVARNISLGRYSSSEAIDLIDALRLHPSQCRRGCEVSEISLKVRKLGYGIERTVLTVSASGEGALKHIHLSGRYGSYSTREDIYLRRGVDLEDIKLTARGGVEIEEIVVILDEF